MGEVLESGVVAHEHDRVELLFEIADDVKEFARRGVVSVFVVAGVKPLSEFGRDQVLGGAGAFGGGDDRGVDPFDVGSQPLAGLWSLPSAALGERTVDVGLIARPVRLGVPHEN